MLTGMPSAIIYDITRAALPCRQPGPRIERLSDFYLLDLRVSSVHSNWTARYTKGRSIVGGVTGVSSVCL